MTRTIAALSLAVLAVAGSGAATPAAAAELVCPPPGDAPGPAGFQVWLDQDLAAAGVGAGDVIQAGFTTWDPRQREFFAVSGLDACLHPASGDAPPALGTVHADFPGHILAEFVVPDGGAGPVQLGTSGQICAEDGTCAIGLVPIPVSGTGPPPDADVSVLLHAVIQLDGDLDVGQPAELSVDIQPRGLWDTSALAVPGHLLVTAARRGEAPIATAEIRPAGADVAGEYSGTLTLPEPGEFTLRVVVPGPDGVDRAIPDSDVLLRVGGAAPPSSAGSSPAPAAPVEEGDADGIPAAGWLLALGALVVGAGLLLRKAIADF